MEEVRPRLSPVIAAAAARAAHLDWILPVAALPETVVSECGLHDSGDEAGAALLRELL